MKLILASESEWRDRLISWLGEDYEVRVSGLDESLFEDADPEEMVAMLAGAKASKVADEMRQERLEEVEGRLLVVGADTVIVFDGEVIGKPEDENDARQIIGKLQGKSHEVLTGLSVVDVDTEESLIHVERTKVDMKPMNEEQIDDYMKTKEWEGKAGGYQIVRAIDKYIGKVDGSVTNVIGLPLGLLVEMLEEMGMAVRTDMKQVIEKEIGHQE